MEDGDDERDDTVLSVVKCSGSGEEDSEGRAGEEQGGVGRVEGGVGGGGVARGCLTICFIFLCSCITDLLVQSLKDDDLKSFLEAAGEVGSVPI